DPVPEPSVTIVTAFEPSGTIATEPVPAPIGPTGTRHRNQEPGTRDRTRARTYWTDRYRTGDRNQGTPNSPGPSPPPGTGPGTRDRSLPLSPCPVPVPSPR